MTSQGHIAVGISKDSPKNASKVILEIAEAVQKGIPNPEIYAPDKYKTENDGSYRAFEKHHIGWLTGSRRT